MQIDFAGARELGSGTLRTVGASGRTVRSQGWGRAF